MLGLFPAAANVTTYCAPARQPSVFVAGRINDEAAARPDHAESTVRVHLQEACRRFGVCNRVQAVRGTLQLFRHKKQME